MPRILIVEDDTDINNSTAEYLRRKGCQCSQAFSGTEGRSLWQAGGVDLLLPLLFDTGGGAEPPNRGLLLYLHWGVPFPPG